MRAPASIATVALAVLLLSGCLPQHSTVIPTPEPSSTPVFSSDEEALAAATAAYAAYSEMSDKVGADGGVNPERLRPLVTKVWFEKDVVQFTEFAQTGRHLSGETTFDSVALQSFDEQSITVYLCVDVSNTRILDSDGANMTPPQREDRLPLEVEFDLVENPGNLILSSSRVWNGGSFCAN